jgi:hypothetical protein
VLGLGIAQVIVGRVLSSIAGRRELAWIESLPFPTAGHYDAFGHGLWESELEVTVTFEEPNDGKELERLLAIFAPGTKVKRWEDAQLSFKIDHGTRFSAAWFVTTTGGHNVVPWKEYRSNRALLLLYHDVVEGVLAPLHQVAPIALAKLA